MLDLGELVLHIGADASGAEGVVNGLSASIGTGLKGATGIAVAAVGTLVNKTVSGLQSCVQTGMNFDSAMSNVAATMGTTTDKIGDLRDFAQEMGATTAFSATEAAEALNYMALAGYNSNEMMSMLPTVLNLAAAGEMDLARASDMVTDTQSALGLSMEETETMVDQWAKTASTTNTSVEQLGDAFLTVGSTMAALGVPTEEASQVLGILADNGIKGSEAGTKYRNMLLSLTKPTDKAAELMESLNFSAFDANGEMKSMDQIVQELNTSLEGMTDQEKQQAIATLFNKTDLAAVNALLATDKERWDEVATAIDGAKGSAEQMAGTKLDNLEGDITLLKSALEGLKITISDSLTPTIRDFVQTGTEYIGRLDQAFQKGGWNGFAEELGSVLADAVVKITDALPAVIEAAGSFIKGFIQGISDNKEQIFDSLKTVVKDMVQSLIDSSAQFAEGGEGIDQGIVDGIISGAQYLIESASTIISNILTGIANRLPDLLQGGLQIITGLIQGITENADSIIGAAASIVASLCEGLGNAETITNLVNAAVNLISQLVTSLLDNLPMIVDAALNLILALAEGLIDAIPNLVERLPEIIEAIVSAIIQLAPKLLEAGVKLIGQLIAGIVSLIPQIPKLLLGVVKAIFSGIVDALKSLFGIHSPSTVMADMGKNMIDGLINGIKNMIGGAISAMGELASKMLSKVSECWNKVKEKSAEIWGNIKDKITETASNIKDKVSETWNKLKDKVQETTENLKEKVQEKWSNLKDKVSETTNNIKEKVSETWNNMKDKVQETTENLKSAVTTKFNDMKDKAKEKAKELYEGVKSKFEEAKASGQSNFEAMRTAVVGQMKETVTNVGNKLNDMVKKFTGIDLKGTGKNIINGFKDGLTSAWQSVTSWASGAVNSLKNTISGAVNWVKNKVSGSHRTGLTEVPYDGYIAELHKGEQVLTAAEANQYEKMMNWYLGREKAAETTNSTVINLNGSYMFQDKESMDYFMNRLGLVLSRG